MQKQAGQATQLKCMSPGVSWKGLEALASCYWLQIAQFSEKIAMNGQGGGQRVPHQGSNDQAEQLEAQGTTLGRSLQEGHPLPRTPSLL